MRIRVSRSLPRIRYKIGLARIKIDKGAGAVSAALCRSSQRRVN